MRFGDNSPAVRTLQEQAKNRALNLGVSVELDVDGGFGPQTATALAVLFTAERELRLGNPAGGAAWEATETLREPAWLKIARSELGQKEIKGAKDNPRIVEYQQATSLKASDDETPWCASFVSWVLEQAAIKSTRSAWARSYESWGQPLPLDLVAPGAIAVFWRGSRKNEGKGHVGFYIVGDPRGQIAVLGGNQSDAVTIGTYSTGRLLGYFWPEGALPSRRDGLIARDTNAGAAVKEQWA